MVLRMGRPAEVPGKPAVAYLSVRVSPALIEYLDRVRGSKSRSRYVRDLIRVDAERRQRQ